MTQLKVGQKLKVNKSYPYGYFQFGDTLQITKIDRNNTYVVAVNETKRKLEKFFVSIERVIEAGYISPCEISCVCGKHTVNDDDGGDVYQAHNKWLLENNREKNVSQLDHIEGKKQKPEISMIEADNIYWNNNF